MHDQRLVRGHCFRDLSHLFDNGGQVKRSVRQGELPVFPAGDEQELFYEFGCSLDPPFHRRESIPNLGLRATVLRRPLHLRAQVGERGA